jgi:hypothetical protein
MTHLCPEYNHEPGEHADTTTATPAIKLDKKLREEILSQVHEEGMVIVHCTYLAEVAGAIRIWNSTVLIDLQSGSRSKLLHAENITIAPVWMEVPPGSTVRFTLIFAPLPKTCETFDLYEDIPQPGGFLIKAIRRNKSDVYNVTI